MRYISTGLALSAFLAGGPPAFADRIYCAADDSAVKIAIESAYRDGMGQMLMHFRGAMALKDEAAPVLLREVKLRSDMLTQSWIDDKSLRLRLYTEKEARRSFAAMDLTVEAGAAGAGPRLLEGRYDLTIDWARTRRAEARQSVKYQGSLGCKYE